MVAGAGNDRALPSGFQLRLELAWSCLFPLVLLAPEDWTSARELSGLQCQDVSLSLSYSVCLSSCLAGSWSTSAACTAPWNPLGELVNVEGGFSG